MLENNIIDEKRLMEVKRNKRKWKEEERNNKNGVRTSAKVSGYQKKETWWYEQERRAIANRLEQIDNYYSREEWIMIQLTTTNSYWRIWIRAHILWDKIKFLSFNSKFLKLLLIIVIRHSWGWFPHYFYSCCNTQQSIKLTCTFTLTQVMIVN